MRGLKQWKAIWAAVVLTALGCADKGAEPNGGTGGMIGDGGTGQGGEGGKAGTGGVGGSGGAIGSPGGAGGDPGEVDFGWLTDPTIWTEVEIEQPPVSFKIFKGEPGKLKFPKIKWMEDCGPGCSSSTLEYADITDEVVLGSISSLDRERSEAYVAVSHHRMVETKSSVRRLIRLSDSTEISALHFIPNNPDDIGFLFGIRTEDLGVFNLGERSQDGTLWVSFGPETGWDFKSPWSKVDQFASWCHSFGLAIEPPATFFACQNGLHVMKERGSSETTLFPDNERSAVGDGNHGIAVWAEHPFDEAGARVSRIRAWSVDEGVRTIMELPGDVCGIAVGRDHIAGFRGEEPEGSGLCGSSLTKPRFFWISREDGQLKEGPVLPAEEMLARSVVTTERFTAAKTTLSPFKEIPHHERTRVTLIRHEDGKMRQFSMPAAGYSMGKTTVALDDEYLYFTRWNAAPGNHGFDRVFRYRLDLFDEIGLPYPPEGD